MQIALRRTPNPVTKTVTSRRDVSWSSPTSSISTSNAEDVDIGPASPIARDQGNEKSKTKVEDGNESMRANDARYEKMAKVIQERNELSKIIANDFEVWWGRP
jgi:hypothetical protein